ncbi:MAG: hypothetical protein FD123_254 [Bacteroidetes bacterium]|nr:MAG: hypothetical protein FD123_254 [Bacteroidota bacterium]
MYGLPRPDKNKRIMSDSNSNYSILIGKLDEFIRKYYKNRLIRGGLYGSGLLLGFFLLVAVLEYFGHFDTTVRTTIFYTFVLGAAAVLGRFVCIPLFKLYKIGKVISHEQAAQIIGRHFANIEDKLLNVLQLHNTGNDSASRDLVEASINQKIKELRPVPFTAAIDLKQNRRYAKYALVPLLVLVVILFTNAGIITDSTRRLVNHGTYFEKQAPFRFVVKNPALRAVEQHDFPLEIKIAGQEVPEHVFITIDGAEYKLDKESNIEFGYTFRNLQKDVKFCLSADGFTSQEYTLQVLPNPIVLNFDVKLSYPKYLNKKDEVLRNTGDLVIPAGTKVSWVFSTRATSSLRLTFSDTSIRLQPTQENTFVFSDNLLSSKTYSIHTANQFLNSTDSIAYNINVIPDLYPAIQVDEQRDSVYSQRVYFKGDVKDDYGFSHLSFNYRQIASQNDSVKTDESLKSVPLAVNRALAQDQFVHFWDLSQLSITPGQQVEYYFEVWDNDGVHGSKSARTQRMIFRAPTLKELAEKNDKSNEQIKSDLEKSITDAKELQKEIDAMHKKVMEKKSLSWEDKKKIQDMIDKQKDLQNQIDQVKQDQQQNAAQQQEYQKDNQSLLDKQEQIQQLFDQLMNEDMKKQLEQLEKLLDNLNKDQAQQELEKMKLSNKDMEKELDRTLELFKQMQVQEKMQQAIDKLREQAKDQEQKSQQSQDKKADADQLKQQQDKVNKDFQELRQELDKIEQLNQQLDEPQEMENTDLQELEIQQQQKESSKSLDQKQKDKASKSQKNAAQKMNELADKMQQQLDQMQEPGEDAEKLREILENLIQLSFDQEALMDKLKKTPVSSPQYPSVAREQNKLKDNAGMIEDSLLALSKRQPKISSKVNQEINKINNNMEKSIEHLAERQSPDAQNRQQQSMTSINNLALMLDESLQQMMQQMNQQNQMKGNGSCKKPGGKGKSKPSMSSLRQMQQQLNQQMKEMQGKTGKQGKSGQNGQQGEKGMSEELARMAAQQEMIRNMLREAMQNGQDKNNKGGNRPGGNMESKMEETEVDLVNKRITAETLKRQQEILNKLLDYEKAEKEREMDNKRKSDEAKNQQISNPDAFFEYNRLKQKEAELLKTVPAGLSPFYKSKVNEYFNSVEKK